jgi:ribose/xylose/arabinose/galactoside ABC-type transport system permease subunit
MNIDSAALIRRARSLQLSNLSRSVPAWITLALLLAWGGLAIPSFLLPDRLLQLGQQVAPLALVALGETIVLLIGGLDLSVGSVLTLSLVLGAGLARGSEGAAAVPFVLVVCLGSGLTIGVINGLLIVGLKIPPLITTIATSIAVQGVAWVYTNGAPSGNMPESIQFAANGRWGFVPVADVIIAVVFLVFFLLLTRSVLGSYFYAIGANPRAARLAGVPVGSATVFAYALSGLMAAAGGLLLGGYIAIGSLDAGNPYVLNALAVALIGGTSFSGGQGGVLGTLVGTAILGVLTALLIQLGIPIALRSVLLAVIVITAAVLQGRRIATER